jgi:hypothetical protein
MGFKIRFKKKAPNKEISFRKCNLINCPYKATIDSMYCKKHLKEYKKKLKKGKIRALRSSSVIDVNINTSVPPPPLGSKIQKEPEVKILDLDKDIYR